MAAERTFQAAPVQVGRGLVASSFQYYLSGDESLEIDLWNRGGNHVVDLSGRAWRESDRAIVPFLHTFNVLSGAAPLTRRVKLDAGALINLRVAAQTSSTLDLGELFGRVRILNGFTGAVVALGTLAQGYFDADNDLAYPGTPIQSMHSGHGFIQQPSWFLGLVPLRAIYQVPNNVRARFLCGNVNFTTSGVAANRAVVSRVLDAGGTTLFIGDNHPVQVANTTIGYNVSVGHPPSSSSAANNMQVPFPADLDLLPNYQVEMLVVNEQVGDALQLNGVVTRNWITR